MNIILADANSTMPVDSREHTPRPDRGRARTYGEVPLVDTGNVDQSMYAWDIMLVYARDGSMGPIDDCIGFIHAHFQYAGPSEAILPFLSNRQHRHVRVTVGQIYARLVATRGSECVRVADACYHRFDGGREWHVDRETDRQGGRTFEEWGVRRMAEKCLALAAAGQAAHGGHDE